MSSPTMAPPAPPAPAPAKPKREKVENFYDSAESLSKAAQAQRAAKKGLCHEAHVDWNGKKLFVLAYNEPHAVALSWERLGKDSGVSITLANEPAKPAKAAKQEQSAEQVLASMQRLPEEERKKLLEAIAKLPKPQPAKK